MAGSRTERRNGKDRRFSAKTAPPQERRGCDRRQFPPRDHSQRPSAAALRLQAAIDEHKLARGLTRISLDELLDVLTRMGYRQA